LANRVLAVANRPPFGRRFLRVRLLRQWHPGLQDSGQNQPHENEREQAEQFDSHDIGFSLGGRAKPKIFFANWNRCHACPPCPSLHRGTLVAPARLLTNETGQLLVPVIDKILSASRGRTQAVDIASAPQHPARAWEVSSWQNSPSMRSARIPTKTSSSV